MSNPPTPTQGDASLPRLLTTLRPLLSPTAYTYLHLPPNAPLPTPLPSQTVLAFFESHRASWTLILPTSAAEALYPTTSSDSASVRASFWPCELVTLDVHSSLAGVGFMAKVSAALAAAGIGCNPVAGWFSDHVFVGRGDGERAVQVLEGVREEAKREQEGVV